VRRVAAAVPGYARPVAWLHEVLEHTSLSEQALLAQGVSVEDLRAIRLLTRNKGSVSDTEYLAHVQMIAVARGPGGRTARVVKRADLADRAARPVVRADGWSPPYERGLDMLVTRVTQRSGRPWVSRSGWAPRSRAGR
jgi:hypothetical protein